MTKHPRGSEWRKWDLHIHSNASDGLSTPQEIIDEAKRKGLSVIALTDHHTADNIDEIKRLADLPEYDDITVISGIEFRSEYGSKSVHFIGLFPDYYGETKLNSTALHDLILSPLEISKTAVIAKGREKDPTLDDVRAFKKGISAVQVDFKKAADLIHRYGGIISIHNGSKSNGLDMEVKHYGSSPRNVQDLYDNLGTLKEELLEQYVDICEIRKESDSARFYLGRFNLPSITASDAHQTSEIGQKPVWIKADPTFDGLKQIIYEPVDRVQIREGQPETKSVYHLIDSVTLTDSTFWNQTIPFCDSLSVIIGGRSTGKSILLESIAEKVCPGLVRKICGSDGQEDRIRFIEEHISSVSVNWKDKEEDSERIVDFFPQSYMYEIAKDQHRVDELVENLIKEDSTNADYLSELELDTKTNSDAIAGQCSSLFSLYEDYLTCCEEAKTSGSISGIKQEIAQLQSNADSLKTNSGMSAEEQAEYEKICAELSQKKVQCDTLRKDKTVVENLKNKNILNTTFRYEFNTLSESRRISFEDYYNSFVAQIEDTWIKRIGQEVLKIEQELTSCTKAIQDIEATPLYLQGQQFIAANKQYALLQERIAQEKKKLQSVIQLAQKRDNLLKQIEEIKQDIVKRHLESLDKTKTIAKQVTLIVDDLSITANSKIRCVDLRTFLEPRLRKKSDDEKLLISVLSEKYESDLENKLLRFINGILDGSIICIAGYEPKDVLCDFMSKNWCSITYDLIYQGDSFRSMSPGKQAFVILKLLLDFSKRECPILIDQPEDSLDNRAIYTELVAYLREKKKRRQIILVSHNPNVVVGADAEQVIVANQHGDDTPNEENVKFQYYSGSLENSSPKNDEEACVLLSQGIREHVCDILEGGKEAFNRREKKYGFRD